MIEMEINSYNSALRKNTKLKYYVVDIFDLEGNKP